VRAVAGADLDLGLVLVGSHTPHERDLQGLAAELGVTDRVRFPGWLSDAELEGLYELADVFVLPSLEEGFGLPILEAMQRGVPVACSNVSSLPEVAGDAAVLFDPLDVDDIRGAITRVVTDLGVTATLVERGCQRCANFTWESTARATIASYRRAVSERARRDGAVLTRLRRG
jgi:glycosyltransferase involved in cell wall biosynthesis